MVQLSQYNSHDIIATIWYNSHIMSMTIQLSWYDDCDVIDDYNKMMTMKLTQCKSMMQCDNTIFIIESV